MNKEANKRVLLMMIQDQCPYTDINKGGLLQLLKFLQPKFEPCSDKYYRDMMQSSYTKCKEKIQELLIEANPAQVSLVLDGWSAYHHSYVGVNVHYIDKDWVRRKINIGCKKFDESHTGEALANFIENMTTEWGIYEKIYVPVTDSAANMVKMFEFLPWDRADCGNHSLQLVINDEILSMPSWEALTTKCRAVCSFANKSTQALIEAQVNDELPNATALHLIQDVPTRWNSTFLMVERFFKLKQAVIKVLGDSKWENKVKVHMYNSDWELMSKVVKVLQCFKELRSS